MAKEIDVTIGGAVTKVKKVPVCISGVISEAKKGFAGVGGAIKEFFSANPYTVSYWKAAADNDSNRFYFSDYYCGVKNSNFYISAEAQYRYTYSTDTSLSIGITIRSSEVLSGKTISFEYEVEGYLYGARTAKYYEFDDADLSGADNATCDMDICKSSGGASQTGTFSRVIGTGHSKEIEKVWLLLWFNSDPNCCSVPFRLTIKNLKIDDINVSEYYTTDTTI